MKGGSRRQICMAYHCKNCMSMKKKEKKKKKKKKIMMMMKKTTTTTTTTMQLQKSDSEDTRIYLKKPNWTVNSHCHPIGNIR